MRRNNRTSLGNRGEELARRFLLGRGFTILETNYRQRWGEVDVVARLGPEVVFVEVRTRSGDAFGSPEESVTEGKARRLAATAQTFLQERGMEEAPWRIDLVAVRVDSRGNARISHVENAVEL